MRNERISLFCKEGRSDKEYHLQLEAQGDDYVVNYQNGRRGSALTSGTRTPRPVPYHKAKALYDSIVKEKLGKHYKPAATEGGGFVLPSPADRFTGVLPQLLNAVPEGEERPYLDSPQWVMQQKFNGHRRLAQSGALGDPIVGINRKGEAVGISQSSAAAIAALQIPHVLLDAESIADRLYVFDLLAYSTKDIRGWPFVRRYEKLQELLAPLPPGSTVELVPVYTSSREKHRAFEKLRAARAEGVTFKHASSPYEPGRPASGGSAMKFKFWKTASVVVERVNTGKRSVTMSVLNRLGGRVEVGSVTIPNNQPIPAAGEILEVRYLYAFEDGCLVQTTSLGVRDDIDLSECSQDQLIYEGAAELEGEATPTP